MVSQRLDANKTIRPGMKRSCGQMMCSFMEIHEQKFIFHSNQWPRLAVYLASHSVYFVDPFIVFSPVEFRQSASWSQFFMWVWGVQLSCGSRQWEYRVCLRLKYCNLSFTPSCQDEETISVHTSNFKCSNPGLCVSNHYIYSIGTMLTPLCLWLHIFIAISGFIGSIGYYDCSHFTVRC